MQMEHPDVTCFKKLRQKNGISQVKLGKSIGQFDVFNRALVSYGQALNDVDRLLNPGEQTSVCSRDFLWLNLSSIGHGVVLLDRKFSHAQPIQTPVSDFTIPGVYDRYSWERGENHRKRNGMP